MTAMQSPKPITIEQLAEVRDKTERVSDFLTQRLKGHLATLYPILTPKRVFGKYLGVKDSVPRAEEAYSHLQSRFRECSGAPFDLRADMNEDALSNMEHGIEVYPWEYTYETGGKAIVITSPVRWVVTYKSDYSLAAMRAVTGGRSERRTASIRQFLINAIGFEIVLARVTGVVQLLQDLRYDLATETGPGLGKLPLATVSAGIPSFRPPDDLILAATRLSGVAAFIELVDLDAVSRIEDPLRKQIENILTK